jgi:hypothetical protein
MLFEREVAMKWLVCLCFIEEGGMKYAWLLYTLGFAMLAFYIVGCAREHASAYVQHYPDYWAPI